MASMAFLAVFLALLPLTALGNAFPPFGSPFLGCDKVECGKGKCNTDTSKPFGFTCECDDGWERTTDDTVNKNHTFLPCIIPKCNLNYTCLPAHSPAHPPALPPAPHMGFPFGGPFSGPFNGSFNGSFFDPCYWTFCGGGNCKKTDDRKHTCECNSGYTNILNQPYLPCWGQCTTGNNNCSKLGITSSNVQSSPPGNQATSFLPGKLHWIAVLIASVAMGVWKQ